jgi:hypothetical protein
MYFPQADCVHNTLIAVKRNLRYAPYIWKGAYDWTAAIFVSKGGVRFESKGHRYCRYAVLGISQSPKEMEYLPISMRTAVQEI